VLCLPRKRSWILQIGGRHVRSKRPGGLGGRGTRTGGTRPAPLADPRHYRGRPAHDRARPDRDEPRAAVGAEGAGLQQRGQAVGRDGVRAVVRQPAAVLRPAGRHCRAQGDVPYRPGRLRRGLRGRRRLRQLRDAGHRPRVPGRVRRDAGAGRAVAADHDVYRPEGAGQGLRCLRRHRRCGRGGRAPARRRADVVPVVALVPVHQPGLRRNRDHGRGTVAAQAAEDDGRQAGHTWRASRLQRGVLHRLRVLERCDARLEHTVHVRVPRRGVCAAGRLRRLAGARQPSAAAARVVLDRNRGAAYLAIFIVGPACSASSCS